MVTKQTELGKKMKAMNKELLDKMLKRAGVSKKDIYETAEKEWAAYNIDLLTPAERKKYKTILL
jgi:hypothetical protein